MATKKGFITDQLGQNLLPITRAELVLDSAGIIALNSEQFLAQNGLPGLVTAAERELIGKLSGDSDQSLSDIYNKLGYINNGLSINNTPIHFYNGTTQTPINITTTLDEDENPTLSLSVDTTNKISIGLNTLTQSGLSASEILRSITVDKYGRVVAVSGSELTNDDIPQTLSGKILSGATTYTTDIADNEKAVVNKAYVDAKFDSVSTIATGALTFGGTLSSWESANGVLANNNHYYKVVVQFTVPADKVYVPTGNTAIATTVKPGDTLIVKDGKLVYIPSGDEIQTSITVEGETTTPLDHKFGDVTLKFSTPFNVASNGNTALISFPQAYIDNDKNPHAGYLSADDYAKFNSYASQEATTYTPTVKSTDAGAYEIGNLSITGSNNIIYGLNNISALSLIQGKYGQIDCPTLRFTENSTNFDYNIYGYNGISTVIDGTTLKLSATNIVDPNSSKYLEILENHKFKVKVGSYDKTNSTIIPGLVDYEEFYEYKQEVFSGTITFASIENKLTDTQKTYHYGSTELVTAITVEI